MDLHTLYAVDYDGTLICGIQDFALTPGLQAALMAGDGQVFNSFVAAQTVAPRITFSTTQIAAALTKTGIAGASIDSGNLLTMYLQKLLEGGTRAGTLSHLRMVVNEGLLIPRRLTADGNGSRLSFEAICTYDGSLAPVVLTADQTLAGSPVTAEGFVVGPVLINSATVKLPGVQSIDLDFGIQETVMSGDGLVYPTFVAIQKIEPVLTINCTEAIAINTYGLDGDAQGAVVTSFYLRKLSPGGTRVANETAQHVKFYNTASKGMITVDNVGGSHGSELRSVIRIHLSSAGVLHPLTYSAAGVIPAGL